MQPHPTSLFDVAKRAVEVADPDASDERLSDLLVQFEDADEPVTSIDNLEERVAIAVEGVDVEIDDPAVSMAAATILYLAHRRDDRVAKSVGKLVVAPLSQGGVDGLAVGVNLVAAVGVEYRLARQIGPAAFVADKHRHLVDLQPDRQLDGGEPPKRARYERPPAQQPHSRFVGGSSIVQRCVGLLITRCRRPLEIYAGARMFRHVNSPKALTQIQCGPVLAHRATFF